MSNITQKRKVVKGGVEKSEKLLEKKQKNISFSGEDGGRNKPYGGEEDVFAEFICFLIKSLGNNELAGNLGDYYYVEILENERKKILSIKDINKADELYRYFIRQKSFIKFITRYVLFKTNHNLIPTVGEKEISEEEFIKKLETLYGEKVAEKLGYVAGRFQIFNILAGYLKHPNAVLFSLENAAKRILGIKDKYKNDVTYLDSSVSKEIFETVLKIIQFLTEIGFNKPYEDNLKQYSDRYEITKNLLRASENKYELYRVLDEVLYDDKFFDELADAVRIKIFRNFKALLRKKEYEEIKALGDNATELLKDVIKNKYEIVFKNFVKEVNRILDQGFITDKDKLILISIFESGTVAAERTLYFERIEYYHSLKNRDYKVLFDKKTKLIDLISFNYTLGYVKGNGSSSEVVLRERKKGKSKKTDVYLKNYKPFNPSIENGFLLDLKFTDHEFYTKQQLEEKLKKEEEINKKYGKSQEETQETQEKEKLYKNYKSRLFYEKLKEIDNKVKKLRFIKGGITMEGKELLRKEIEELSDILDQYEARRKELELQIEKLSRKEKLFGLSETEQKTKEELENLLIETKTEISKLEREIEEKAKTLKEIMEEESQINVIKKTLDNHEEVMKQISQILNATAQTISTLSQKIENNTNEITELKSSLDNIFTHIQHINSSLTYQENKINDVDNKLASSISEIRNEIGNVKNITINQTKAVEQKLIEYVNKSLSDMDKNLSEKLNNVIDSQRKEGQFIKQNVDNVKKEILDEVGSKIEKVVSTLIREFTEKLNEKDRLIQSLQEELTNIKSQIVENYVPVQYVSEMFKTYQENMLEVFNQVITKRDLMLLKQIQEYVEIQQEEEAKKPHKQEKPEI